MKITFYELLGLVKDGKAPKKIKYNNIEREYSEENEDYYSCYGGGLFEYKFGNCKNFLNDEVSIIEESKKIEKLKAKYTSQVGKLELANKINELIDEINNLKENN